MCRAVPYLFFGLGFSRLPPLRMFGGNAESCSIPRAAASSLYSCCSHPPDMYRTLFNPFVRHYWMPQTPHWECVAICTALFESSLTGQQFEKIFVINIPARHDKRDALSLAASTSNFRFEWLDGVDGSTMTTKSKPPLVFHPS